MDLDVLVEAVLFSSDEPVKLENLSIGLGVSLEEIERAIDTLDRAYLARGIYVQRVAGGLRIATRPEVGKIISQAFERKVQVPLSRGALETLSIIAYCQPVTRQDIQAIRGVNPEASIDTLMEKGLIEEVGRKKTLGRPKLYGTTEEFLKKTSLNSISDLPPLKPD
ncbi:MAG: SMC-Scp complex subunit ScpB [Firmicutes bacterium]|nr:SMC-Scp complex subunit ScpB [Candidatus Fermentithermobacillaceae bacterium]